ncbi:MAG TPA: ParB N-terminal domain-containing protein [Candidatus Thermoplasmatota archaeon]|nr:ParB N-terminal domain-containing protein [Candidatus Thermoplasmatota archaeon]
MSASPAPSKRHVLVPLPWLKAHEKHVEQRVAELVHHFELRNAIDYAIVADERTGTVIDGHHRLMALRQLGAAWAPVYLIDYASPAITVHTWREGEKAPSKEEVVERAARGELYPPKSTRHDFVRMLDPVDVPLEVLRDPTAGGRATWEPRP